MTTLTFEVEVNDEAAGRIRQSEQEHTKINLLLKSLVETPPVLDPKKKIFETMDRMSSIAESNGLTEEKLAEILEEIDQERG